MSDYSIQRAFNRMVAAGISGSLYNTQLILVIALDHSSVTLNTSKAKIPQASEVIAAIPCQNNLHQTANGSSVELNWTWRGQTVQNPRNYGNGVSITYG